MASIKVQPSGQQGLKISQLLQSLDVDGDGDIDEEDRAIRQALLKMDQDGDGHINLRELVHISKEKVEDTKRIKNLRKYIAASTIIMLTFIALSLCCTIAAIELTKEVRSSSSGQLVGSNKEPIMTAPTQDAAGSMISSSGKPISVAQSTRTVSVSLDTSMSDLFNLNQIKYNVMIGGEPAGIVGLKPVSVLKTLDVVTIHCDGGWVVVIDTAKTTIYSPSQTEYGVASTMRRRRGLLQQTARGEGEVECKTGNAADSDSVCAKPSCPAGQYVKYDDATEEEYCSPCGGSSYPEEASPPYWCECETDDLMYDEAAADCKPISSATTPVSTPLPTEPSEGTTPLPTSPSDDTTPVPAAPTVRTGLVEEVDWAVDNFPVKSINVSGAEISDGKIEFYKLIDSSCLGDSFDDPHPVHGFESWDDGFIFSGKGLDAGKKFEAFTVKLSKTGDCIWGWTSNQTGLQDAANAAVQLPNGGDILTVGFREVGGVYMRSITKMDVNTGAEIWTATAFGDAIGSYGAFENAEISADGTSLVLAGLRAKPDKEYFFKSYGNAPAGRAIVMKIPVAALTGATPPTSADVTWSYTDISIPDPTSSAAVFYFNTCKAARVMPNGDVAAIFYSEANGIPNSKNSIVMLNSEGTVKWGPVLLGQYGEGTDVVPTRDGTALFVSGLGDPITAGRLTKVLATDGSVLFSKHYRSVPVGNAAHYINECWSVESTEDGGALIACGTGIEDCSAFTGDQLTDCTANMPIRGTDTRPGAVLPPVSNWQSYIIRTDADGELMWQRVDARRDPGSPKLGTTGFTFAGSASEYVARTRDGGYVFVQDEAAGLGILKMAPAPA